MTTITSKSGATAVISTKGAELVSFQNKGKKEYIWEGNPVFWAKHAPVLFPIVGTLAGNSYDYNGRTYSLSRHGFARDMNFELVSRSESEAVFLLASAEETLRSYPFAFALQLRYVLDGNTLHLDYSVFNRSDQEMPFSIGAHPAFALPGNFTDYSLEFEKEETLHSHLLENDLLSEKTKPILLNGKKLPLNHALFANDALVFKNIQSHLVTILEKSIPLLKITYPEFRHLGIWTKPGAPFVCIEPWLGYSDTVSANGNLFEKEAIQILAPQAEFNIKLGIEIL